MTGPSALTEEDLREMVLRLAHEIRNPLAVIKSGVQLMQHKGHVWSYDFLAHRTEDGRPLRMLTVMDEYTRE